MGVGQPRRASVFCLGDLMARNPSKMGRRNIESGQQTPVSDRNNKKEPNGSVFGFEGAARAEPPEGKSNDGEINGSYQFPRQQNAERAPAPRLPANYDPTGTGVRCVLRRSTPQAAYLAASQDHRPKKKSREPGGVRWRQRMSATSGTATSSLPDVCRRHHHLAPAMLRTPQYCGGSSC
jgi:hypothetical protein